MLTPNQLLSFSQVQYCVCRWHTIAILYAIAGSQIISGSCTLCQRCVNFPILVTRTSCARILMFFSAVWSTNLAYSCASLDTYSRHPYLNGERVRYHCAYFDVISFERHLGMNAHVAWRNITAMLNKLLFTEVAMEAQFTRAGEIGQQYLIYTHDTRGILKPDIDCVVGLCMLHLALTLWMCH